MNIFYRITGKKLINIIEESLEEKKVLTNKILKHSRKYGFSGSTFSGFNRDGGFVFNGFNKNKNKIGKVNGNLWRYAYGAWVPKKNTKEGRQIDKEICDFSWAPTKIAKAVGWKNIYTDSRYYTFNWFCKPDKKFYGFVAPILSKKRDRYKPVSGIKEIKPSLYSKYIED